MRQTMPSQRGPARPAITGLPALIACSLLVASVSNAEAAERPAKAVKASKASATAMNAMPTATAPPVEHIDLEQAETIALQHDPAIAEAFFRSRAASEYVKEVRSGFFPQVTGEIALVGTGDYLSHTLGGDSISNGRTTRIGASGGLNNPSVLSRESNGVSVTQLITDFGRTSYLTTAARFDARASNERAGLARAQVLIWTDEAYFHALEAQALIRVAKETIANRDVIVQSTQALAQNQLRSQLDVSFAQVAVQQARLLLLDAENRLGGSFADLSAALGYREPHTFLLEDENLPAPSENALPILIYRALESRPEAIAARYTYDAALKRASADKVAGLPKINLLAAMGRTPAGDQTIRESYAAAGVNVEIPLFTGGRLSARAAESTLEAQAANESLRATEQGIVRDVNHAWLNANEAAQRIQLTRDILAATRDAFELAKARYQTGIASIVELSQADLNLTQAQIDFATATYERDVMLSLLEFQTGATKFIPPGATIPKALRPALPLNTSSRSTRSNRK